MWNRILLIVFLLTPLLFPINSQTIDEENPIISWEPIPNASSYQLQVRNEEEEIILEEDTEEISYKLNLDPGKYSHRVGAYNKFKKIASYSEWFPFVISRVLAPEVTSEKKIFSIKSELKKTILITGNNFYKDTKTTIKNANQNAMISSVQNKKGVIEVILDNENTKAGNYDLILENPRKKILVIKDYYILKSDSFFSADVDPSYPYWKEAGRSALLPGWGQVRKKQFFSAIFLNLFIIAGAGYYKSSLDNFSSEKSKYDQAVMAGILYQEMKIPFGAFYGFFSSESQFHKVESSANSVPYGLILMASFYCINILDALLWKSSTRIDGKETSFHFFTKIQMIPVANGNMNATPYSNSSQVEIGLRFQF